MKAVKLLLVVLTLVAGTTAALAAAGPANEPDPVSTAARSDRFHAGLEFVAQNEAQKHRLEAQGFPQYVD